MTPPQKLGPFEVVRELGRGGMGVVYEVRDPLMDRTLALKLLLDGGAEPVALERFRREAEVLARVRHRSVVRVHKTGRLREGTYLLEELVVGETLRARCARGPLEPREAARIVRELADALVAVHAAGVLHRDLKPGNVVLAADGIPVLLDFGVARDAQADRLTRTGAVVGSVVYMAPEQANGVRSTELDARVDVYGLGAVLYELLTGQPPFAGGPTQVLLAVLREDPPWPAALRPEVPAALDAVVRVAMSKAREARYPDAAALRADLDRFLAEGRTQARPLAGAPGGLGRPARLGLAAAALVGVAVAVGGALLAGGAGPEPAARPPSAPDGDPASAPPAAGAAARAAAPGPTGPGPQAPAPLWALAPGDELELAVDYAEAAGFELLEARCALGARARASGPERLELELEVRGIQVGVGSPMTGAGTPFDSRAPDPEHPLAPIAGAVGGRFTLALDPRTGALLALEGVDALRARVDLEKVKAIATVGESHARAAMRRLLDPGFFGAVFGSVLHVRGAPALPWRAAPAADGGPERPSDVAFVLDPVGRARLVPPLLAGTPPGTAAASGRAEYAQGRLRAGSLAQEATAEGGASARWTVRLAE